MRRLRENHVKPAAERRPAADVVRDATLEIRTSIVFATIIIVLVFLPIFGLSGVEGRLLTPLAFAYIVALLASLVVAIIVTPALCFAFLPNAPSIEQGHDGWLSRHLKHWFGKVLPPALDRPALVMAMAALLLVVAGLAMTRMGTAFLPEFHEGSLTVQANTLPGHLAGQVRRDRPPRRADPAGTAGGRRHGAPDRPRRATTSTCRASKPRRSTSACATPAGRARTARRSAARILDAARHQRDDRSADLASDRPHAVGHARQALR